MKNFLAVIHNKKIAISGDDVSLFTSYFSTHGLYFDKVEYVGYDSVDEISRCLIEMKGYNNCVIICPPDMFPQIQHFVERLYNMRFNQNGMLHHPNGSVFITDERLSFNSAEKICEVVLRRFKVGYRTSFVKTVGASVREIREALDEAKAPGVSFIVHGVYSENTIEILYDDTTAKTLVDAVLRSITEKLGKYVYALEDISLTEQLYLLLKLRRMKISVAESFTGGGICKRLVETPGISEVFYEGINAYSNESKIKRLGVRERTINKYGAVSSQTAKEMAQGLFEQKNCDISISTTGIAGPKSDGTNKPVGLCFIGVATNDLAETFEFHLNGDRKAITETAINRALFIAYETLK